MKLELYQVAMRCPDTTAPEKAVLGALLSHADDDGTNSHPGNERLAVYAGVSTRRVQDILKSLRAKGWVERTKAGSRSRHAAFADVYSVTIPMNRTDPAVVLSEKRATGRKVPVGDDGEDGATGRKVPVSAQPTGRKVPVTPEPTGSFVQNPPEENFRTPGPYTRSYLKNTRSPEPTVTPENDDTDMPTVLPESWTPNATHRRCADRAGIDVDDVADDFRHRMAGECRTDWDAAFGAFVREAHAGREDDVFPMRDPAGDHEPTSPAPAEDDELLPITWQRPSWLSESDERVARYLAGHPDDDQLSRALAGHVATCERAGRDPVSGEFRLEVRRHVLAVGA